MIKYCPFDCINKAVDDSCVYNSCIYEDKKDDVEHTISFSIPNMYIGYDSLMLWYDGTYRGKKCDLFHFVPPMEVCDTNRVIYPEHNNEYLIECLENLDMKNAPIDWESIKNKFNYQRKFKEGKENQ